MDTELYEKLQTAVKRESRIAENRWNKILDADDIEQEIWLWLLERPNVQSQLAGANAELLGSALRKAADQICSRERLDYDHFSGNFHYIPAEVREILEDHGEEYDVHEADEKIDLQLGLDDLLRYHPNYFEVIESVYWHGETFDNSDPRRKVKDRAVDKLTEIMNRKRGQRERDRTEGPGTKPRISTVSEDDSSDFYKED